MHRFTTLAAVAFLAPLPQLSQASRPIAPEDLWKLERLTAMDVSRDGSFAIIAVQTWSIEENKSSSSLWQVDLRVSPDSTAALKRLTRAQASDGPPLISPDGSRVAFVSKRSGDETGALYVMPLDGGEPEEIIELPYGVQSPRWLPDGSGLVFASRVIPELAGDRAAMEKEAKRRKESKVTGKVTENRTFRSWDTWKTDDLASRLYKVSLADKSLTDLTPGFDRPFSLGDGAGFDISPDGRHVALTLNSTPPPYRDDPNSDIYLIPVDGSGTMRNLTADNPRSDGGARFSPDGRFILFGRRVLENGAGENERLWRHDLASGKNTPVAPALDLSFESWKIADDGTTVYFTAEDRGILALFRMALDRPDPERLTHAGSVNDFALSGSTAIALHENFNRPNELVAVPLSGGNPLMLTSFNAARLAELDLGKVESVDFEGAAGRRVQMWVVYPPQYDSSAPHPLLQLMHGGPHTMVRDAFSFRWNAHVFAAAGHVVAWVNRHGSTGFGEEFARSIIGEWGVKPMEDVMRATDFLLARHPNIDPKRVAAGGASYGGYLASWILGHTDRFACLVNHAGVYNLYGQFAGDFTYGWTRVFNGTPWENLEGFQRNNPAAYARNFRTPTLVVHGELDYRVPVTQGLELYGTLQAMGVPSRLLYYPNENHWILTPQNSIHWNVEVRNWLVRHIGGTPLEMPSFEQKKG